VDELSYTQLQQDFVKRNLLAVIYCRVSTDKQEQDGESLEYQEEKCRKYAELHGIEVVIVLKEAKSGYIHYSLREKLSIARQMIRDGIANMIIVWDLRRFSRFHMFVELDMSLRAITHHLTETRIPTPFYRKKSSEELSDDGEPSEEEAYPIWRYTTIREMLKDPANIGILVICKEKQTIGPDGKRRTEPHPNRREVPGGIPAIIHPVIYERAQEKLETHKVEQSHRPLNEEDFLLRGHIVCGCCKCAMKARTQKKGRQTKKGTDKSYPFYRCTNYQNKYSVCPSMTAIRTSPLDAIVWQECCILFKRLDIMQAMLEHELEAAVNALLEDTTGQEQIQRLEELIAFAKNEREKYPVGSYMHNLISQDINNQKEQLARYEEELGASHIAKATNTYKERIVEFLEFLNVMRGRYESATFQEQRNALEVLGVKVIVHDPAETYGPSPDAQDIAEGQEWFSAKEAGRFLGVHPKTIHFYKKNGTITNYQEAPHLIIHKEEVLKLQEKGFLQRNTEEIVRGRIEITYSPRFNVISLREMPTGVQVSLQTRRYIDVSACKTPGTL
jgi:predicted site-specific integrase-resolvase